MDRLPELPNNVLTFVFSGPGGYYNEYSASISSPYMRTLNQILQEAKKELGKKESQAYETIARQQDEKFLEAIPALAGYFKALAKGMEPARAIHGEIINPEEEMPFDSLPIGTRQSGFPDQQADLKLNGDIVPRGIKGRPNKKKTVSAEDFARNILTGARIGSKSPDWQPYFDPGQILYYTTDAVDEFKSMAQEERKKLEVINSSGISLDQDEQVMIQKRKETLKAIEQSIEEAEQHWAQVEVVWGEVLNISNQARNKPLVDRVFFEKQRKTKW